MGLTALILFCHCLLHFGRVYRAWDYVASMPLHLQFPFLYSLTSPLHQLFWRKVCAIKEDCLLQCDICVQNPSERCACHAGSHAKWMRIHFTASFHFWVVVFFFFPDVLMILRLGHVVIQQWNPLCHHDHHPRRVILGLGTLTLYKQVDTAAVHRNGKHLGK